MDWIREGGWPVMLLLSGALCSHPLALAALVSAVVGRSRRWTSIAGGVSLAAGALALAIGVAGYFVGMSNVEAAVASVSAEYRDELYAVGRAEARISLWVGLATAALPGLAGGVALGRAALLRKTGESAAR
jgi:hypothetical protein